MFWFGKKKKQKQEEEHLAKEEAERIEAERLKTEEEAIEAAHVIDEVVENLPVEATSSAAASDPVKVDDIEEIEQAIEKIKHAVEDIQLTVQEKAHSLNAPETEHELTVDETIAEVLSEETFEEDTPAYTIIENPEHAHEDEPEPDVEPDDNNDATQIASVKPDQPASLPPVEDPLEETRKPNFFARLTHGLMRSSTKLADGITSVFTKKKLDDDTLEELEDLLISSDLGANVAIRVCENIRKDRFDKEVTDEEIKQALAAEITDVLSKRERVLDLSDGPSPRIVLFVGVNGSGKTTTIGKIASKLSSQGASILLAAGDTFRAAAVEQLKVWSERANAGFISRPHGADAAGLAFDAIQQARKENRDLVLIDTAGRLQNRSELMEELAKVVRAIRKIEPDAPHDVILVLDATVGQNALSQVEAFKHTAGVTGLVMTKLDGTAKGGVLVAIADKHDIPIHFVGVGEKAEDLHPFSASAFAKALVGLSDDVTGN